VGTQEQVSSLSELGKLYGSDKPVQYTPFYDLLFTSMRERVKSVFEIGIFNGGSLRMWRDYFPNAHIYGMDILEERIFQEERIKTFQGDQASLAAFGPALKYAPFDLIIDDGSHAPHHQVSNAEYLMPYLKPGGLYIIEDINPPVLEVSSRLPFEHTIVEHHPLGIAKTSTYMFGSCLGAGRCILIRRPDGEIEN